MHLAECRQHYYNQTPLTPFDFPPLGWLPGGECATYYAAGHIENVHPETQKLAINFSPALAKPNGKWVKDSHWLQGQLQEAEEEERLQAESLQNFTQLTFGP